MLKRSLNSIQIAFAEADRLLQSQKLDHDTAINVLKICGTALQCQWGTFWLVDPSVMLLNPIATWSNQLGTLKLEQDTQAKSLSLSEGNAGHVWRSKKPIWTVDLIKDMCIPRSLDAETAGLHGGIWFALKTERAVYGVIELLGVDLPEADDELLAGIEILGIHFGKIIEQNYSR